MTTALAIPENWTRDIEQYEQKKYNVLAPRSLGPLPAFHTPRLEIVMIDANKESGDVYQLPGGKWGLSKVALDRISQAAGISWIPDQCGRVDDGSDSNIIRYKAVGRIKDLSGTWRTILGEKEVDLLALEDELTASVPEREWILKKPAADRPAIIEKEIRKEMVQYRKHRLARAQSGAMNRAIRAALALRSSYTIAELSRPFVLPKVLFTPDASDPETKRFLLADATGNVGLLYGGAGRAVAELPPAPILEAPEDDEPPVTTGTSAISSPVDGDPTQDEQDEIAFREAYNAGHDALQGLDLKDPKVQIPRAATEAADVQLAILEGMLKRKDHLKTLAAWPTLKKPLADFTPEQRLALFQRLIDLHDPAPAVEEPAFS